MKSNKALEAKLENLRSELQGVRRASLLAARRNDFMRLAKLTTQASSLSRAILQAEGLNTIDFA